MLRVWDPVWGERFGDACCPCLSPQLLIVTLSCCAEPQAGSAATWTMNVPRLPAPCFDVTVTTLDPLPSIRCSDRPRVTAFPLPSCEAVMMRTPLPFVIVKIAEALSFDASVWLRKSSVGLIDDVHCVPSVDGVGVDEGVGVGDAFPFPFPLSFPPPG